MPIRVKEGEKLINPDGNRFELESNSCLSLTRITFADQDVFQSFEVVFLGENASCELYFLDCAKKYSHLETNIRVIHKVPNCVSKQVHKGLYAENSTGILKCFIEVSRKALGTDALQLHRSLLLSPNATSKPEPHFQIAADAVKCKHGVSIGQLDEKALFYLKSRGLHETAARRILIEAFAQEITDRIPERAPEVSLWI